MTKSDTARHFVLTPVGSHGDTLPFVALGAALRRRGHRVSAYTAESFVDAFEQAGVKTYCLMSRAEFDAQIANAPMSQPRAALDYLAEVVQAQLERGYAIAAEQAESSDTRMVCGPLAFGARVAQERLGLRMATVQLAPAALMSAERPARLPIIGNLGWLPLPLRRLGLALTHRHLLRMFKPLQAFRAGLSLPPMTNVLGDWMNSPELTLALFPEWFSERAGDWPASLEHCAFPRELASGAPLPTGVGRFLRDCQAKGCEPLVATPGTAVADARRFFDTVTATARALDRPALLLSRFKDAWPTGCDRELIHCAEFAPLDEVLPHTAALIHPGGIGATSQALMHGVPQYLTPLGFDQFDNAARIAALGAGQWRPWNRLSAARMTASLAQLLTSPDTAVECERIAKRMANEDGISLACDRLEAWGTQG